MSYKLRCVHCGRTYEPNEVLYTCPVCGPRLGTLEVVYDTLPTETNFDLEHKGIWAFSDFLPIKKNRFEVPLLVGNTPLYEKKELAKEMGLANLYIKDDGRNPTASYKDRASALAIAKAKELGYDTVYCASTGNAASSLSGLAAASGIKSVIFVPKAAPQAKITQLLVYGATVIAVDGSYDDAFDLSLQVGEEFGWYCRNSAINPYLLEGKKTGAMEAAYQLDWKIPDVAMVSVGDGTVVSSIYKGFRDLKEAGITNKIPKIIGVQAEGANAVMRTFESGIYDKPQDMKASSMADSISVGKPRDVLKACKYVESSGGKFISVSDEEIGRAIVEMARKTGVFAEPAGATTYAGLKKISKELSGMSVILFITGNGLKDINAVRSYVGQVHVVKPELQAAKEVLKDAGAI